MVKTLMCLCMLVVSLAGCQSIAMNGAVRSWQGAQIPDVVRQWGALPTDQQAFGDRKFYVWVYESSAVLPAFTSTQGTIGPGGSFSAYTTGSPGGVITGSCAITFETAASSDVIVGGSWAGGNCCVLTLAGWCGRLPRQR